MQAGRKNIANRLPLAIAALALIAAAPALADDPASLILVDGRIYTAGPDRPVVEAMAVRAGKVVYAGDRAGAMALAGPQTEVRQLDGRMVLPGLIDSHIHPEAIVDLDVCDLQSEALSLAQIAGKVRECIARKAIPDGEWVMVDQWYYAGANQTDPDHPTIRAALDKASPRHPIKLLGLDGHHYAFNSPALALAARRGEPPVGLNAATLKSHFAGYSEYIGVDAAGEPDGYITESAGSLMPAPTSVVPPPERFGDLPDRIGARLAESGITAIQSGAASSTTYAIFDSLQARDKLTLHVQHAQFFEFADYRDAAGKVDFARMVADARQLRERYVANPLIRAEAVKLFADGVLEGNPLALPPTLPNAPQIRPFNQPIFGKDAKGELTVKGYVDTRSRLCRTVRKDLAGWTAKAAAFQARHGFHPAQCKIGSGRLEHPRDEIMAFATALHQAGFTLHIHAIGDMGVRTAIDAIEAARASDGKADRPDAIAHIQLIAPEDVARMGKHRIIATLTFAWANTLKEYDLTVMPFIDRVIGNSDAEFYSPRNYTWRQSYPARQLIRAGGIISGGSDAPVETRDPRPFYNIQYAVTRQHPGLLPMNPAERLTIVEALDTYTVNGAKALGMEQRIGSLEPGKAADFIVIDRDIIKLAADPAGQQTIRDTRVLETWFAGRKVYKRGS